MKAVLIIDGEVVASEERGDSNLEQLQVLETIEFELSKKIVPLKLEHDMEIDLHYERARKRNMPKQG